MLGLFFPVMENFPDRVLTVHANCTQYIMSAAGFSLFFFTTEHALFLKFGWFTAMSVYCVIFDGTGL